MFFIFIYFIFWFLRIFVCSVSICLLITWSSIDFLFSTTCLFFRNLLCFPYKSKYAYIISDCIKISTNFLYFSFSYSYSLLVTIDFSTLKRSELRSVCKSLNFLGCLRFILFVFCYGVDLCVGDFFLFCLSSKLTSGAVCFLNGFLSICLFKRIFVIIFRLLTLQ